MRRLVIPPALAAAFLAAHAPTQRSDDHGTLVIVVGQEATLPIPTLLSGRANEDVADLLFLKLARLGPDLVTAGDRGFVPELARRWTRRDSLTLAFELDTRARWHDGRPVTSRDVVFTFTRARDRAIDPQRAVLLRHVESVAAEGDQLVVIRFSRAYSEQLYDAVWHVRPLPAHLLDTMPPDRIATSPYALQPVGNGPYRWGRREPGRQLELIGVGDFFLGSPKINRVVLLLARDPEAQLNLILDGTADALESITPVTNVARVQSNRNYRILPTPTFSLGYLLFNQRAYGDRSQPHPILGDAAVRRAITMALDREAMVRATFGNYAAVPEGPVTQLHWIRNPGARPTRPDVEGARRLLTTSGWRDTDGDGVLDRNGQALSLRLMYPGTSAVRGHLAAQAQERLGRLGVRIELVRLDAPVWLERRSRGEFDIDFASATMDPSPAGLVQSWSCAGRSGSNVGQYCNPRVDSLLDRALVERQDARRAWRDVVRTIIQDAPAVFMYAPTNASVIHRRYADVTIRPESYWSGVWRWRVPAGRQLPRDRASSSP